MSESLYDILGVKPDASDAELKQAYRNRARQHHPDAKGDEQEFIKAAHAYKVLSDPSHRLLYDRTGNAEPPNIDKEVQSVLIDAFQKGLHSREEDVLGFARAYIQNQAAEQRKGKKILLEAKAVLTVKRSEIDVEGGGTNLWHALIDEELKNIEASLEGIKNRLEVAKRCNKELDGYGYVLQKQYPWMALTLTTGETK